MRFTELLGTRVSPEDQAEYSGMPRHPGRVLAAHVVFKTTQVGAVLGTVGSLASGLIGFPAGVAAWAANGALVGAPVGVVLIAARARTLDVEGVVDRGYRIVHNDGQRGVDRLATLGAVAGLALQRNRPLGLSGAGAGIALGVLCYPLAKRLGFSAPARS